MLRPTILLFSTTPRAGLTGGMEHVVEVLAEGLRADGHRVVESHAEPTWDEDATGSREQWGLPLSTIRTWRKIPTPRSIARWAADTVSLARRLRRLRPNVVNVHHVTDQALPFLLLRPVFGYRLVLTSHGSDVLRTAGPLPRLLLPRLLARADAVIAVSDAVAARVRELAPHSNVTEISNGVDLSFWTPPPPHLPRAPRTIVHVGRLHEVKAQDVLLRALAIVRTSLPDVQLELIGEGPDCTTLTALADSLGLGDTVTFTGSLPPDQVRDRLRGAAVFALPSRSEGLPLSMLEAMACGTPVVASAVGGIPAAVGVPPAVSLVPPDDPDALADALRRLLTDSDAATSLQSRALDRVSAFSWDRTFASHRDILVGL